MSGARGPLFEAARVKNEIQERYGVKLGPEWWADAAESERTAAAVVRGWADMCASGDYPPDPPDAVWLSIRGADEITRGHVRGCREAARKIIPPRSVNV